MRRNVVNKDMSNLNNVRNVLKEGDEGEDVEKLQNMLMSIVHIYPTLPVVTLDGKYNSETRNAVEEFQNMMGINKKNLFGDPDSISMYLKDKYIYEAYKQSDNR